MTHVSSVPTPIGTELTRVQRRWASLPFDRADALTPAVLEVAQRLADRGAAARGRVPVPLPDLGPAVVVDQLRVMVHDAWTSGVAADDIETELRGIRQLLS